MLAAAPAEPHGVWLVVRQPAVPAALEWRQVIARKADGTYPRRRANLAGTGPQCRAGGASAAGRGQQLSAAARDFGHCTGSTHQPARQTPAAWPDFAASATAVAGGCIKRREVTDAHGFPVIAKNQYFRKAQATASAGRLCRPMTRRKSACRRPKRFGRLGWTVLSASAEMPSPVAWHNPSRQAIRGSAARTRRVTRPHAATRYQELRLQWLAHPVKYSALVSGASAPAELVAAGARRRRMLLEASSVRGSEVPITASQIGSLFIPSQKGNAIGAPGESMAVASPRIAPRGAMWLMHQRLLPPRCGSHQNPADIIARFHLCTPLIEHQTLADRTAPGNAAALSRVAMRRHAFNVPVSTSPDGQASQRSCQHVPTAFVECRRSKAVMPGRRLGLLPPSRYRACRNESGHRSRPRAATARVSEATPWCRAVLSFLQLLTAHTLDVCRSARVKRVATAHFRFAVAQCSTTRT